MTTTTLSEFFSATNPVFDPLWHDLTNTIKAKAAANPRHLQVELGPSEIGHPCMRKLAFGLMNVPACNPEYDCLPSTFGVAMHAWLADAFAWENERLGRERWIIETKVHIVPGLFGSADLYDTDTGTVVDWKNLGYTSYDKYVKNIGPTYRGQIHTYGRGFVNAGYDVRRVAIAILPRSGTLSKMHLHIEDYDPSIVDAILARREAVMMMLDDFDVENNLEHYEWFPKAPSECLFCPWWRPESRSPIQCNGKLDK